jgi:predicted NAD/FAD-binding protein
MLNQDKKIAIIGAGPSGVSAAYYLKEKGYRNITLFEKEDRIGGKCCTYSLEGHGVDLGATLISPSNTHLLRLFKRFQAKVHSQIGHHLIYHPMNNTLLPIEKSELLQGPFSDCLSSLFRFVRLSYRYRHLKKPGYHHIPTELLISFDAFITTHHLQPIRNLFILLLTHMGYGKLENIPAYTAIKFLKIRGVIAFFTIILTGKNYFNVVRLVNGFQPFWEEVVRKSEWPVILSADIKQVQYENDQVIIHDQNQVRQFDKLIVSVPFNQVASLFANPVIEANLMKKVCYLKYVCHLFKIHADHAPQGNIFVMPPNLPSGLLMIIPCPGLRQTYTSYSSNEQNWTDEEIKKSLIQFLGQFGIASQAIEFIAEKHWDYFPHVSIEAVKEGFYDDISAAQGISNTYYNGDLLAFESVEQCVGFSQYLVEKYF